MPKNKSRQKNKYDATKSAGESSRAKLVLFIFGIGPIILITFFLAANGFFS